VPVRKTPSSKHARHDEENAFRMSTADKSVVANDTSALGIPPNPQRPRAAISSLSNT